MAKETFFPLVVDGQTYNIPVPEGFQPTPKYLAMAAERIRRQARRQDPRQRSILTGIASQYGLQPAAQDPLAQLTASWDDKLAEAGFRTADRPQKTQPRQQAKAEKTLKEFGLETGGSTLRDSLGSQQSQAWPQQRRQKTPVRQKIADDEYAYETNDELRWRIKDAEAQRAEAAFEKNGLWRKYDKPLTFDGIVALLDKANAGKDSYRQSRPQIIANVRQLFDAASGASPMGGIKSLPNGPGQQDRALAKAVDAFTRAAESRMSQYALIKQLVANGLLPKSALAQAVSLRKGAERYLNHARQAAEERGNMALVKELSSWDLANIGSTAGMLFFKPAHTIAALANGLTPIYAEHLIEQNKLYEKQLVDWFGEGARKYGTAFKLGVNLADIGVGMGLQGLAAGALGGIGRASSLAEHAGRGGTMAAKLARFGSQSGLGGILAREATVGWGNMLFDAYKQGKIAYQQAEIAGAENPFAEGISGALQTANPFAALVSPDADWADKVIGTVVGGMMVLGLAHGVKSVKEAPGRRTELFKLVPQLQDMNLPRHVVDALASVNANASNISRSLGISEARFRKNFRDAIIQDIRSGSVGLKSADAVLRAQASGAKGEAVGNILSVATQKSTSNLYRPKAARPATSRMAVPKLVDDPEKLRQLEDVDAGVVPEIRDNDFQRYHRLRSLRARAEEINDDIVQLRHEASRPDLTEDQARELAMKAEALDRAFAEVSAKYADLAVRTMSERGWTDRTIEQNVQAAKAGVDLDVLRAAYERQAPQDDPMAATVAPEQNAPAAIPEEDAGLFPRRIDDLQGDSAVPPPAVENAASVAYSAERAGRDLARARDRASKLSKKKEFSALFEHHDIDENSSGAWLKPKVGDSINRISRLLGFEASEDPRGSLEAWLRDSGMDPEEARASADRLWSLASSVDSLGRSIAASLKDESWMKPGLQSVTKNLQKAIKVYGEGSEPIIGYHAKLGDEPFYSVDPGKLKDLGFHIGSLGNALAAATSKLASDPYAAGRDTYRIMPAVARGPFLVVPTDSPSWITFIGGLIRGKMTPQQKSKYNERFFAGLSEDFAKASKSGDAKTLEGIQKTIGGIVSELGYKGILYPNKFETPVAVKRALGGTMEIDNPEASPAPRDTYASRVGRFLQALSDTLLRAGLDPNPIVGDLKTQYAEEIQNLDRLGTRLHNRYAASQSDPDNSGAWSAFIFDPRDVKSLLAAEKFDSSSGDVRYAGKKAGQRQQAEPNAAQKGQSKGKASPKAKGPRKVRILDAGSREMRVWSGRVVSKPSGEPIPFQDWDSRPDADGILVSELNPDYVDFHSARGLTKNQIRHRAIAEWHLHRDAPLDSSAIQHLMDGMIPPERLKAKVEADGGLIGKAKIGGSTMDVFLPGGKHPVSSDAGYQMSIFDPVEQKIRSSGSFSTLLSTDLGPEFVPFAWAAMGANSLAPGQERVMDYLMAVFGVPETPEDYAIILGHIFQSRFPPFSPVWLIERAKPGGKGFVDIFAKMDRKLIENTKAGLDFTAEIGNLIKAGSTVDSDMVKLFTWTFLSRMLSAFPHESGYLQAVKHGLDGYVDKVVKGEWSPEDAASFLEWVPSIFYDRFDADIAAKLRAKEITLEEAFQEHSERRSGVKINEEGDVEEVLDIKEKKPSHPGVQATQNLNSVARQLYPWLSLKHPDGDTNIAKLHKWVREGVPTREIRRRFLMMPNTDEDAPARVWNKEIKPGFQNKILSFALLMMGRHDAIIMDRIEISSLFAHFPKDMDPTSDPFTNAQRTILAGQTPYANIPVFPLFDKTTLAPEKWVNIKTYRKALEPEEVKNAMRKTGLYAEEDIAQGTKAYEEFRENLKIKAAGLTPEEASRYIIPDFQTSDISQGLSKAFDGPRGTAHYELIEAIIRPRIKEAFEANGIDLQQDVGVFHWLVWNYFGGQEASHESAIELVRTIVEDDIRFPGITAREARYNVPLHGVEYTISPDFKEICIWRLPSPDGYADKAYVFPVGFYGTLANEIKGIAEKHFLKKNGKKYSIAQLAQNVPYWMERIPGPDGELTDKTYATPRFFAEVERFLDSLVKHGKAEDFVSYGRAALQQIPDWRVIPEPLRRLLDGVDVGPIGGRPKLEAEGGGSHPGGHQDYVVPLSRRHIALRVFDKAFAEKTQNLKDSNHEMAGVIQAEAGDAAFRLYSQPASVVLMDPDRTVSAVVGNDRMLAGVAWLSKADPGVVHNVVSLALNQDYGNASHVAASSESELSFWARYGFKPVATVQHNHGPRYVKQNILLADLKDPSVAPEVMEALHGYADGIKLEGNRLTAWKLTGKQLPADLKAVLDRCSEAYAVWAQPTSTKPGKSGKAHLPELKASKGRHPDYGFPPPYKDGETLINIKLPAKQALAAVRDLKSEGIEVNDWRYYGDRLVATTDGVLGEESLSRLKSRHGWIAQLHKPSRRLSGDAQTTHDLINHNGNRQSTSRIKHLMVFDKYGVLPDADLADVPFVDSERAARILKEAVSKVDNYERKNPNEARAARTFALEGKTDRYSVSRAKPFVPSERFTTPAGKKPLDGNAYLHAVDPLARFVGQPFVYWIAAGPRRKEAVAEYISAFVNEYGREPDTLIESHTVAVASIQEWPPYEMTRIAGLLESLPDAVYSVFEKLVEKDGFLPIGYVDMPGKTGAVAACLSNGPLVFNGHSFIKTGGVDPASVIAHELWHFVVDRAFDTPLNLGEALKLHGEEGYRSILSKLPQEFQTAIDAANDILDSVGKDWLDSVKADPSHEDAPLLKSLGDLLQQAIDKFGRENIPNKVKQEAISIASRHYRRLSGGHEDDYGAIWRYQGMVAAQAVMMDMGVYPSMLERVFENPAWLLTNSPESASGLFSMVADSAAKNGALKNFKDKFYDRTPFGPLPKDAEFARTNYWVFNHGGSLSESRFTAYAREAFPGAEVSMDRMGRITVRLKNGREIQIRTVRTIVPDKDILLSGLDIDPTTYDPNDYVIHGSWELVGSGGSKIGAKGLITLAKAAKDTTLLHESIHAARSMGLISDKEWSILVKRYASEGMTERQAEEAVANAYEEWTPTQKDGVFRTIWKRFVALLKGFGSLRDEILYSNANEIFRKLRSGEIWARPDNIASTVLGKSYSSTDKRRFLYDDNNPLHVEAKAWFESGRFADKLWDKNDPALSALESMWEKEQEPFKRYIESKTGRTYRKTELLAAWLAGRMGWERDLADFHYERIEGFDFLLGSKDTPLNALVTIKLLDLYEEASKGKLPDNIYDAPARRAALMGAFMRRAKDWDQYGLWFPGYLHEVGSVTHEGTDEVRQYWPGATTERETGRDKPQHQVKKDEVLLQQAKTLLYKHGRTSSDMMDRFTEARIEEIAKEIVDNADKATMKGWDPTRPVRMFSDAETQAARLAIEKLNLMRYQADATIVTFHKHLEDFKRLKKEGLIKPSYYVNSKKRFLENIERLEHEKASLDERLNRMLTALDLSGTAQGRAFRARQLLRKITPWHLPHDLVEQLAQTFRKGGKKITDNAIAEVLLHAAKINYARLRGAVQNTQNAMKHEAVVETLKTVDVFEEFKKALETIRVQISRYEKQLGKVWEEAKGKPLNIKQRERVRILLAKIQRYGEWHQQLAREMMLGADWGPEWKNIFLGKMREKPELQELPKNYVARKVQAYKRDEFGEILLDDDGNPIMEEVDEIHARRPSLPAFEPIDRERKWAIEDTIVGKIRRKIMAKRAIMESETALAKTMQLLELVYRQPADRKAEAAKMVERKRSRKPKQEDQGGKNEFLEKILPTYKEFLFTAQTRESLLLRLEALKVELDPDNKHSVYHRTADEILADRSLSQEFKRSHAQVLEDMKLLKAVINWLEEMTIIAAEQESGVFRDPQRTPAIRHEMAKKRLAEELGIDYDQMAAHFARIKKIRDAQKKIADLKKAFSSEDNMHYELAKALGYVESKTVAIGERPEDIAEVRLWQDRAEDLERQGEILLNNIVPTDGLSAFRSINRAWIFTNIPARILDFVSNAGKQLIDNNILSRYVDGLIEKVLFGDVLKERGGRTLLNVHLDGGFWASARRLYKADAELRKQSWQEFKHYFKEMAWNRMVKGQLKEHVELPTGQYGGRDKFGIGTSLNLREHSDGGARPWLTRAEGFFNALNSTAMLGDMYAMAFAYNRARFSLVDSIVRRHLIEEANRRASAEEASARADSQEAAAATEAQTQDVPPAAVEEARPAEPRETREAAAGAEAQTQDVPPATGEEARSAARQDAQESATRDAREAQTREPSAGEPREARSQEPSEDAGAEPDDAAGTQADGGETPEEALRRELLNPETPEGYRVHIMALADAMEQVYMGREGQIESILLNVMELPDRKHHSGPDRGQQIFTSTARGLYRIMMDLFVTEFPRIFMRIAGWNTDFLVGYAKILGAIVAENQKAAHAASKKATGEAIKGVDYWDELATKRVASLVRRNTIGLGMLALAKLYVELEEEGKVPSIATYNNETGRFQFVNVASPVLSRLVGKQTADVLVPLPLDQLGGPFSLFAFAYSQWKVARNPELTEAMRKNRLYGDAMAFMFSNPMLQGVETWLSIALGKGVSKDWGYVSARLGRAIGTTVFPGITRAWEIAYDRANNFGQRYATNFLEGMIAPTIFGRNLAISASGKVFPNLPKQYQVEFVKAGYEPSLPPSTEDKEELLRWMSDLASTEAYGPLRPASVVVTPEDHARWTHLFTKYGALYAIKTIESQPYKNSPTKLPARIKVAGGTALPTKADMLRQAVSDARTTALACALMGMSDSTYKALARSGIKLTLPTKGSDEPAAFSKAVRLVGKELDAVLSDMPQKLGSLESAVMDRLLEGYAIIDSKKASNTDPKKLQAFKTAMTMKVVPMGLTNRAVAEHVNYVVNELVGNLTQTLIDTDPRSELASTTAGKRAIAEMRRAIRQAVVEGLFSERQAAGIASSLRRSLQKE